MKYINKLFFIVLISVLLFSCKDEDTENIAGIEIDKTELNLYDAGGEEVIEVKAGGDWIAKSDASWCLVSPANGNGNAMCHIKVDPSTRYDARTAKVTFICGSDFKTVTINQLGYAPSIQILTEETTVPYYAEVEKSYLDVEVLSNVAYDVVIDDAASTDKWLWKEEGKDYSYTPSQAKPESKTYRFHYDINSSVEDRTLNIKFVQKTEAGEAGIETVYKVTQEHMEEITPSRRGDSLTLVTMARLMDLYGNAWDTSRPITHWENVETEEVNGELRVTGLSFFMFDTDRTVPFLVKNLTELRTLEFRSNSNSYLKSIKLGDEIAELKNLKSLSFYAYGLSELPAPEVLAKMTSLEELNLYGNSFLKLGSSSEPGTLLWSLSGLPHLKYLELGGNRKKDSMTDLSDLPIGTKLEDLGLTGRIPAEMFTLFPELEYLSLVYNYLEGEIPEVNLPGGGQVMPKLRTLRLSSNMLSGTLPKWLLNHPNLGCWDPEVLVFTQSGKDSQGDLSGFTNVPVSVPACPDLTEEEESIALNLRPLTEYELTKGAPLSGNWRYYQRFNLWKDHEN